MGADYSYLHQVMHRKIRPSIRFAKRIQQATNGLIHWWEFFLEEGEPAPPDERQRVA